MRIHQNSSRQKISVGCLVCITFLFFLFVMWDMPLTSDDFEHSTLELSGFGDLLRYALYYGNGRTLGNLGSVCLVRMPIFTAVVKAFVLTGVFSLLPWVCGVRNTTGFMMSFLLFVSIPSSLFGEIYTWTSGFQNYIPPVWIALVTTLLIQNYEEMSSRLLKVLCCVGIFILGIAGQLYVEHASLMNLLCAASFVYGYHKAGKNVKPALVWLIAAAIGLAMMFLIPVMFHMEGNRSEGYRSVNLGGIGKLISSCKYAFSAIGSAFPPLGSFVMAGLTAVTTYLTRSCRSIQKNKWLYCISFLVAAYILVNECLLQDTWYGGMAEIKKLMTALVAVLPFFTWAVALFRLEDRGVRGKVYFALAMAILSNGPLLFVSPTPSRVVFQGYVYTVAAIVIFGNYLMERADGGAVVWVNRSLKWAAAVLAVLLCLTFHNIRSLTEMRETYIQQQMQEGKTEITIFEIPYDYVFPGGAWAFGRGYFYEQWHDIFFTCVEYAQWHSDYR